MKDHKKIKRKPVDHRWDLLCKVRYSNNLPDIPFDPKFITYPFEKDRFIDYSSNSLELNHKYDLLTSVDMGIPIDLIIPETYARDDNAQLHADDLALLHDDIVIPSNSRRSVNRKNIAWLRKTEYLSSETIPSRPLNTILDCGAKEYKEVSKQIETINKQFDNVKRPIMEHPTKKGVRALTEKFICPDKETWKYSSIFVTFDTDISKCGYNDMINTTEQLQDCELRGINEDSRSYLAFFVPTPETLDKRKLTDNGSFDPSERYIYIKDREFAWKMKNKDALEKADNFYFVMRDDGVYYNTFDTRVNLNSKHDSKAESTIGKVKLIVANRDSTTDEIEEKVALVEQLYQVVPTHDYMSDISEDKHQNVQENDSDAISEDNYQDNKDDLNEIFADTSDEDL